MTPSLQKILLLINTVIFCFISMCCHAQIAGVTPRMVNAINHQPIDEKAWEIEPNFNWCQAIGVFGQVDSERAYPASSFTPSLRVAYGVSGSAEIGGFLAQDFANISLKYKLADGDIGLAVIGGAYIPFKPISGHSNFSLGLAFSKDFDEKTLIDFNFQYQRDFVDNVGAPQSQSFVFLDLGHYISSDIMLMLSVGQQVDYFDFDYAQKVSVYPGIVIEKIKNQIIAFNAQYDMFGNDLEQVFGLALAWTFLF